MGRESGFVSFLGYAKSIVQKIEWLFFRRLIFFGIILWVFCPPLIKLSRKEISFRSKEESSSSFSTKLRFLTKKTKSPYSSSA